MGLPTCVHLGGRCPVCQIPGSLYCASHSCPRCNADKSSQFKLCKRCDGGRNDESGPANEEDQLNQLVSRGAITDEEHARRLEEMKNRKHEVHKLPKPPRHMKEVQGPCQEVVENNSFEQAYKFSFDFAEKKWRRMICCVTLEADNKKLTDWTCPQESNQFNCRVVAPGAETAQAFVDVEMQSMGHYFAELYNSKGMPKAVKFRDLFILERYTMAANDPNRQLVIEQRSGGKGEEDNFGFLSYEDRQTPLAFSHFTYIQSGMQHMLTNIRADGEFFSSPQVISQTSGNFGPTDKGKVGSDAFLKKHRCNCLCNLLGLAVHDLAPTTPAPQPKVSYDTDPSQGNLDFFGINLDQFQSIKAKFKEADEDASGELSLSELPELCRKLNRDIPTSQLMGVMNRIDTDHSGEISLKEFLIWWTGNEP